MKEILTSMCLKMLASAKMDIDKRFVVECYSNGSLDPTTFTFFNFSHVIRINIFPNGNIHIVYGTFRYNAFGFMKITASPWPFLLTKDSVIQTLHKHFAPTSHPLQDQLKP